MKRGRKAGTTWKPIGPPSITEWDSPEAEIQSYHANDGKSHTRLKNYSCGPRGKGKREIIQKVILCKPGCISYREWCALEVARLNARGGSMVYVEGKPFVPVPVEVAEHRGRNPHTKKIETLIAIVEAKQKQS